MGDRLQYALALPFSPTSLSVSWPWAVSACTVSVWHRRSCFPRFWSRSCASFLVFGTMPLSTRRSTSTPGSTHSDLQKAFNMADLHIESLMTRKNLLATKCMSNKAVEYM